MKYLLLINLSFLHTFIHISIMNDTSMTLFWNNPFRRLLEEKNKYSRWYQQFLFIILCSITLFYFLLCNSIDHLIKPVCLKPASTFSNAESTSWFWSSLLQFRLQENVFRYPYFTFSVLKNYSVFSYCTSDILCGLLWYSWNWVQLFITSSSCPLSNTSVFLLWYSHLFLKKR